MSNGGNDVFVTRFSATGSMDRSLTFGGIGSESVNSIAVDALGTLSLAGAFVRTTDFDPDLFGTFDRSNAAYADLYMLRLRQS